MDILALYELSAWLQAAIIISLTTLISVAGLLLMRKRLSSSMRISNDSNEGVNGFFAGVGVFYGLLLGLVAVATWDAYEGVSNLVSKEASEIASLYRDVSSFPQPEKSQMQAYLREYLVYVIEEAWPAHQQGIRPGGGTRIMTLFQGVLTSFHPVSLEQQALQAEAMRAFNQLVEATRLRVDAVDSGLPPILWIVVLVGAILSIFMTYFFHFSDITLHLVLTGIMGIFIGLMFFLIFAIDNPFRGDQGVSSESYLLILNDLDNLDPATFRMR
ncbi:MAG: hypothetical protein RIQ52_1521 [Pseudomonadota bacterium]|jgi:hypothetical protein